MLML
ncbi:hypothetical protein MTR67_018493 [Solanum verrucosum]|jgi:hypothetical protein